VPKNRRMVKAIDDIVTSAKAINDITTKIANFLF
jgi:hypothetical protein